MNKKILLITSYNQVFLAPVLMYLHCLSHRKLVAGDITNADEARSMTFFLEEISRGIVNLYGDDKGYKAMKVFLDLINNVNRTKTDAIDAIHKIV